MRLRTFFFAVAIIAVPLSWYARQFQLARSDRTIIAAMERTGATVGPVDSRQSSWVGRLVFVDPLDIPLHVDVDKGGALASIDRLRNVESVVIGYSSITDADLFHLRNLNALRELHIRANPITDLGVGYLSNLTSLRALGIECKLVGDTGVASLKNLRGLRGLWLRHTRVSSDGLKALGPLPQLTVLNLSNTRVDDEGVQHLCHWRLLEEIYLDNTAITDESIRELARLKHLARLCVSNTQIGDVGLARLSLSQSLEDLDVSSTQITDSGLAYLLRLPHLFNVTLANNRITDVGLAAVEKMGSRNSIGRLNTIDLSGTGVTEAGVMRLVAMRAADEITIINTNISPAGIHRLEYANPDVLVWAYERRPNLNSPAPPADPP